jgi:glutamate formiminotransferase
MSTLVECVPNFSEGRDNAKVDAIIDAMKMPGVYLLDRESGMQFRKRLFAAWAKRRN